MSAKVMDAIRTVRLKSVVQNNQKKSTAYTRRESTAIEWRKLDYFSLIHELALPKKKMDSCFLFQINSMNHTTKPF